MLNGKNYIKMNIISDKTLQALGVNTPHKYNVTKTVTALERLAEMEDNFYITMSHIRSPKGGHETWYIFHEDDYGKSGLDIGFAIPITKDRMPALRLMASPDSATKKMGRIAYIHKFSKDHPEGFPARFKYD